MSRYPDKLLAAEGRLLLAGVEDRALVHLRDTGMLERIGVDNVFRVTPMLGEALQEAAARAMQLRDGTG